MHPEFEIRRFILTTLIYSAEFLTDFGYTNFSARYRNALDRLRVHLNIDSWVLKFMPHFLCTLKLKQTFKNLK